MLGGLILFAISNKIGIGLYEFTFRIPQSMLGAANIFRASGRMFWPVFYALLIAIIFVIVRGHSKRVAIFSLVLALVVQIVDTSAGWWGIHQKLKVQSSSEWQTPLTNPFWADAASRYGKIHWIPPRNAPPNWQALAAYAGRHGLATDAVYLARVGERALAAARLKAAAALSSGQYDPDSLYVLDPAVLGQAVLNLDSDTDLVARIDGFDVLAPGWKQCADCLAVDGELQITDVFPPLELGARVEFSRSAGNAGYLVAGWSQPEAAGTWSDGPVAEILLPLSANDPRSIVIEAVALTWPSHPEQDIEIHINETLATTVKLTGHDANRIEVLVPQAARKELAASGLLHLELRLPDAVRPADIGLNSDTRSLALHLLAITVD